MLHMLVPVPPVIRQKLIKAQKRGGKGRSIIKTRDEDFVVQIFTVNSHTPVLFFSTQGLVYKIKAWKIPEGSANSKGKTLFNILPLKSHQNPLCFAVFPARARPCRQTLINTVVFGDPATTKPPKWRPDRYDDQ